MVVVIMLPLTILLGFVFYMWYTWAEKRRWALYTKAWELDEELWRTDYKEWYRRFNEGTLHHQLLNSKTPS